MTTSTRLSVAGAGLVTAPESDTVAGLAEMAAAMRTRPGRPRILGAHLEGPFLSPDHAGTHRRARLREPDLLLLERLLAAGPVTSVTLAPELPGADVLVRHLVEREVLVWAGHTGADAPTAHAAFDLGIRAVTHLFNAMRPFHHRDPGVAGAALARDDVALGLVVGGIHLADDTVHVAMNAAGDRVVLVTDAMAAAGRGAGRWRLGGVDVEVVGGQARRPDGVLAGSVLTMDQAVRNLVALGVPADVVVLDDALEVRRVLCGGHDAAV